MKNSRRGFTLVELLIVVVIMAVLAATIIPQFADSTSDAKSSAAEFNLHTLRAQIELYKANHGGEPPSATLAELTSKTDGDGNIGTGAAHVYGPYIRKIPSNPFNTDEATNSTVTSITNDPAQSGDVTGKGWLYNADTGGIWIDHADHYEK